MAPSLDSYYNATRLLFHVYNHYQKAEGVDIRDLTGIDEAINGTPDNVYKDLVSIVKAHETAIDVAVSKGEKTPSDLLYNTALVYTELIEYLDQEELLSSSTHFPYQVELAQKAKDIFQSLLEQQVKDFQNFYIDLESIQTHSDTTGYNSSDEVPGRSGSTSREEFTSEEVLQPNDIFETVLSSLRLVQALLEIVSNPVTEIGLVMEIMGPFMEGIENIALNLLQKFYLDFNTKPDLVSSINENQKDEYNLLKTSIRGLTLQNLEELYEVWKSDSLPLSAEKYILASDNIQNVIDRDGINLAYLALSEDNAKVYWKALTQMSSNFKVAYDMLRNRLEQKKKETNTEGAGQLIAIMSSVMIARADIDLQRSQILNLSSSVNNKNVLLQNSKAFLKSALNISNSPGGLREPISDKVFREKKKTEAATRLCILEGKSSIEELDSIIGRKRWVREIRELIGLSYFDAFGIRNIHIPDF